MSLDDQPGHTDRFAGLYYPPNSLKSRLCLRGRQLLYDYCEKHDVPFQRTGKLVVATEPNQLPYLEYLRSNARSLLPPPHWTSKGEHDSVLPLELLSGDQARELEPELSPNVIAALWSPETGIIDSHAFMQSLQKDITANFESPLSFQSRVVRVDPTYTGPDGVAGWVVQAVPRFSESLSEDSDTYAIFARVLINASGLSGPLILNSLLDARKRIPMYYARGSYASYTGPGISRVSHLIYPCPEALSSADKGAHAFQSLGTHLTLDLQGKVRFGPDLEWISPPKDTSDVDFWMQYLAPDESRIQDMHEAISRYLPGVELDGLKADYAGIRPKLVPPGGGFQDFVLRKDYDRSFLPNFRRRSGSPMISLMGIESPGLTASLAIAEMVVEDMLVAENDHIR